MKFLVGLVIFLCGTSVAVAGYAQNKQDSVIVLPVKIAAPGNARKLGSIRVGNNATRTTCNYEEVIQTAKAKARQMGGNIVKITELVEPAFISKCYSIKADVYAADALPDYHQKTASAANNGNYALICIYRLKDTLAIIGGYKLHMDADSVICTVKNKSWDSIKVYKEGPLTLWGEIEKRTELKLNVKFGKTYYVRCGVRRGEIRMIPVIQQVDEAIGKNEFDKLKKHKHEAGADYLQQIH